MSQCPPCVLATIGVPPKTAELAVLTTQMKGSVYLVIIATSMTERNQEKKGIKLHLIVLAFIHITKMNSKQTNKFPNKPNITQYDSKTIM